MNGNLVVSALIKAKIDFSFPSTNLG